MRAVRVLLSARDPGSAAHARALVPALRSEPQIALTVAASGPAFDVLEAAGARPLRFALPDGAIHIPADRDPAPLLRATDALLEQVDPDVLVVGVSSLGMGIDEALLARAGGRPAFALQDYPGDANAIGGRFASTYFVRDEGAARLTGERFGVRAVPVGSLKHAAYASIDVSGLRRATRERIGVSPDAAVLGFFAQPPDIPGHEAAFGHLVEALARLTVKPLVLLREHPKFPDHRERHSTALARAGVTVRDAGDGANAERWLAACDVVTTCFSHCSMDYAFLSAWSPEPLGSVLFLLTAPETRRFLRDYAGLAEPDGVEAGLGRVAERPAEVAALLGRAFGLAERRAYHEASRRLPRSARLDVILAAILDAGLVRIAGPGIRS